MILAVTAFGDLPGRAPVRLSGAQPGDVVAFAGRLGWAAAGFSVLSRGFRSPVQVVNAHRRPEPPYAEGVAGRRTRRDRDDRRVGRAGRRPRAHRRGQRGADRPASDALDPAAKLRDVSTALNTDPMTWVLGGGDDYALVATFPNATRLPDSWQVIGMVGEGSGVRVDGLPGHSPGHEHFR